MGCVVAAEIVVFIVPKVSCDQGVVGVKEPSMDIKIKPYLTIHVFTVILIIATYILSSEWQVNVTSVGPVVNNWFYCWRIVAPGKLPSPIPNTS